MKQGGLIVGRLLLPAALLLVTHILQAQAPVPPAPPVLPSVEVLAADPTALVGASSGAFTFVRTGATAADLIVTFTLSGTATNGVDYTLVKETITIPAGYEAADLVIQPLANPAQPGNKTVLVKLAPGATPLFDLGKSNRSAQLKIIDNVLEEPLPSVTLTNPPDGSTFTLPVVVPLGASASDVDNDIAHVSFFMDENLVGSVTNAPYLLSLTNPAAGTHELFARAVDVTGKAALSAPVHITVVAPNQPMVKLLSPTNGTYIGVGGNITITGDGSGLAPYTLTLFGNGKVLASATNTTPLTFVVTNLPPREYNINAQVRDALGKTATAAATVFVTNAPPVVTLTSPANSTHIADGGSITVTANGSGLAPYTLTLTGNGKVLASATNTTPLTFVWTNLPPGEYNITAQVRDAVGQTASARATVLVAPPVVTLTSPTDTHIGVGGNITITANGSGMVPYTLTLTGNGKVLATVTNTTPLTFVWTNLPPGEYNISAQVRDGAGRTAWAGAFVTVTNAPPVVTLTSPADGANFAANSTIPLAATASEPGNSFAQVQVAFYADGRLVGKPVTQSPYTMNLTGLKAGTHTIQAVATDQYGQIGRSATVHISVSQ
ncbi:MAG: Ig-like domain-containing protein [Verrucomicrobiota bacterium]|jgi:uncharacterized protein (DUF2141 family)